jgi:phospholipase C
VPAVIVSPYARPGFVTEQVYDHTSVLALIERKWNLPPLTARDAAAADPLGALDLESPPHFLTPPDLPRPGPAGPVTESRATTETPAEGTRRRGRSGRAGAAR